MKKIQTQGIHHITLLGADRQTSVDFWEGVPGMPLIFEQPNLDVPEQNHLYFDPGDGRLITVFTREELQPDPAPNPEGIGNLHHIAFIVSRATYTQAAQRLNERGVPHSGEVDRRSRGRADPNRQSTAPRKSHAPKPAPYWYRPQRTSAESSPGSEPWRPGPGPPPSRRRREEPPFREHRSVKLRIQFRASGEWSRARRLSRHRQMPSISSSSADRDPVRWSVNA